LIAVLAAGAFFAKRVVDHRRANPPFVAGVTGESLQAALTDQKAWVAYVRARSASLHGVNVTIHTVQPKDNFWKVASAAGVTIHAIVGSNPALPDLIAHTGEEVVVPDAKGCIHALQPGESLASVAATYGVEAAALATANGLTERELWWGVSPGTLLFIANAEPKRMTEKVAEKYRMGSMLASPLAGRYTSFKGSRSDPFTGDAHFHNGVDLAVPQGTWVGSAADGRVTFAGERGGYGKCIQVKHDNGFETLYGHLSKILVREGQHVKRRQLIAKSGSTGRSTGPHLHFAVWKDGKLVSPEKYISIW